MIAESQFHLSPSDFFQPDQDTEVHHILPVCQRRTKVTSFVFLSATAWAWFISRYLLVEFLSFKGHVSSFGEDSSLRRTVSFRRWQISRLVPGCEIPKSSLYTHLVHTNLRRLAS